ncbi:hypothetical protein ABDB91_17305 [Desulfoscipio sp. XC116]|uniref:hypothetical protein n=1 Tax=Desulfoscipio sp. XC116 TaxID=3144975 RepID=UPI00325ACFE7
MSDESGSVVFARKAAPPLAKGDYVVEVAQSTQNIADCKIANAQLKITVSCDGFALSRDEIYSVYPPDNAVGTFHLVIPHAVFKRRTLPWERRITGGKSAAEFKELPWLALLVFDETEDAQYKTMSRREAFKKLPGYYCPLPAVCPEGAAEEVTGEDCGVLDIEAQLFHAVCPGKEDLVYMSHAKGVSLDDKVTDSTVIDDWFSCALANRYLEGTSGEAVKQTAYVVSLEYFGEYLDKTPAERAAMTESTVRIPVLYSWPFYVRQEDFDFASVFKGLNADCLITAAAKEAGGNNLLAMGYTLLDHELREGSKTVSWYRGPLTPCGIPLQAHIPGCFADALLRYDPATGMFDTAYSAAWQLGRMLALRSKAFAAAMEKWRYTHKREAARLKNERLLSDKIGSDTRAAVQSMLETFLDSQERQEALKNGGRGK